MTGKFSKYSLIPILSSANKDLIYNFTIPKTACLEPGSPAWIVGFSVPENITGDDFLTPATSHWLVKLLPVLLTLKHQNP